MIRVIFLLSLMLIVLTACASQTTLVSPAGNGPEGSLPNAKVPQEKSRAEWEIKWEKIVQEAKKEGKVVIYGSSAAASLQGAIPEFKKKFGIALEVTVGTPIQLVVKIAAERAAGLYIPDVFIAGQNTHFTETLPRNWAAPMEAELILPEVTDTNNWFDGKLPFQDKEKRVFSFYYYPTMNIAINTDLVKGGEIKSYFDLLQPKWKGKIILNDPTVAGTAFNGFTTFVHYKVLDLDYFRQLVKQGQVVRDRTLQVDWVARGKYPVILWPDTTEFRRYKDAGTPLEQLSLQEGNYLTNGGSVTTLLNQRPHPNAARIFINWLFGREGQLFMQKDTGYHSTRVDIGIEGVDSLNARQEGVKYYPGANLSIEWIINEEAKYRAWAREIFVEGK